jgi:hypothetical protein
MNLTETRRKVDHFLLPSTEPILILADTSESRFSKSETIVFARVFDLYLRF